MAEFHDLLDRQATGYRPPSDLFDRVLDRRRRRDRNRRLGSAVLALVVAVVVIGGLLRAFADTTVPADPHSPFFGAWHATDADGSPQTMTVQASDNGAVEIVLHDQSAAVCSGGASTTTGAGRIEGTGELVIPSPELTCDDGSEPGALSALQEQLRDLTFVHDREADTLSDSFTTLWARQGEVVPEPTPDGEVVRGWPRGWPDTTRNKAGVYSWDPAPDLANHSGPECGSAARGGSSCIIGFIHNGYGSGDVEIRVNEGPEEGLTDGVPTTVAGYEGFYQRIDPRREWWIVEIEGTTIVIRLEARPGTSQADLAEAHAIIDSLRTQPQENDLGFRLLFRLTTGDWDSG